MMLETHSVTCVLKLGPSRGFTLEIILSTTQSYPLPTKPPHYGLFADWHEDESIE
jgi:hypothetical protein